MSGESPADLLAEELQRHDRDRFLATLLAPAARRPALWALLAFNLEIARVREAVSQPVLGQIRLQWWRDALAEIYDGKAVRRHFVATPLAEAIRALGIPRAPLDAMIDGRERDLDDAPFESIEALETYAEATSSKLVEAMLAALSAAAPEAARHVGIAWALVGLIRAIPFHARAGRLYVPDEAAGRDIHAGRVSPAVTDAVRRLAETAERHIAAARALRGSVPKRGRTMLAIGRVADAYLKVLKRSGYDPFTPSLAQPDALAAARLWWASVLKRY